MYPRIYKRNETDFNHNGYGFLKDLTRCEVIEEDNGIFELEGECTISSFLFEHIQEENIIKAWASEELGEQLFRIYRVQKDLNGYITFNAQHISYDLLDNFIESIELIDVTCENAINEIFNHCAYKTTFKGYSDITHKGNIILQRVNPMEAIRGARGSICDTFGNGPKVIKDNFNIRVNANRGSNNNVLIAYKKNLTGFESEVDTSDLVTVIFPYATIQRETGEEGETEEETIQLPEKYIYSEYHQNYNNLKIIPMDFSGEDVKTVEHLRARANNYFKNSNCDTPKVNYKVEFIPLSKTINYSDYKILETVSMCDTVIVRDYRFNLDVKAQVVKTTHCALTKKILSCELGNFKYSLSNVVNDINKEQAEIIDRVDKVKINIDNEIGEMKVTIKDEASKLESNIKQTAEEINLRVSDLNGKYTELKQTVDGIDITGVVTFKDLENTGSTIINGSNITTGTLNADKVNITNINADNITTGTIRGIQIISNTSDSANRVEMVSDGHYYYSPSTLTGKISFDSNGEGTSTSAKDRFLIQSLNGYVLKLLSTGDMSLTSYDVMYLEGNKVQTNCNLDLTGNRLDCGNIYCSNNITCTSVTLTNEITAPSVSATTIKSTGTFSGKTGSFTSLSTSSFSVTGNSWLGFLSCGNLECSKVNSTGNIITTGGLYSSSCSIGGNMSVDNNAWIKYLYVNGVQVTSDQTLKTDIKRVNIDKQTISEDSGLMSPNVNITTQDMHEFIETLPMVSYRLIEDVEKGKDETYYGFLAQEILYSKVGSELISVPTEEEQELVGDKLRYSVTNYISFIAGALQEEIRKRKDLETKIDNLTKAIDNLK